MVGGYQLNRKQLRLHYLMRKPERIQPMVRMNDRESGILNGAEWIIERDAENLYNLSNQQVNGDRDHFSA